MDTTTIEITDEQKAALDDLKTGEHEPYKSVVGRLLDGGGSSVEVVEVEGLEPILYNVRDEINAAISAECGDAATVEGMAGLADELESLRESVADDDLAREVARKIDYTELATQVADEIEGRLR